MLSHAAVFTLVALIPATRGQTQPDAMPPGMRLYQLGLLGRGARSGEAQGDAAKRLLDAHHAHLQRAFEAGTLVASGPISGAGDIRGIVIFAAASLDEAVSIAQSDPAVMAGALSVRMLPWWGPEGVGDAYRERFDSGESAEDVMVEYQFALLVRGERAGEGSPEEQERIQREHLAHLARMGESGALVAAGPFEGGDELRGVAIYRVDSLEAARQMAEADPAVQAGRLGIEMLRWSVAEGVLPR